MAQVFFLMIRRPPRSTLDRSSAASDVYKRQRRILARQAEPQQQARAVLALTRPECVDPALSVHDRAALDEWRVAVLDRVDTARLPPYLKNRVAMRRAGLWS